MAPLLDKALTPLLEKRHARHISVEDVRLVLSSGKVVESYPDDTPYPSCLTLGWVDTRPLHRCGVQFDCERDDCDHGVRANR